MSSGGHEDLGARAKVSATKGRAGTLGVTEWGWEGKAPVQDGSGADSALASLSHEIRTPLTALLGSTQLLLRNAQLSPEQRDHLEIIHRSGMHLCDVMNEVLEMTRIHAGRATLRPVAFNLLRLVEDVAALGRDGAESRGLGFEVEVGGDVPRHVFGDACKLQQVLTNVLGNALKFTRRGHVALRVDATTEAPGCYELHVEVEDTGVGIADCEKEGLFQPFAQTSSGRGARGGTGLGLALSRDYIHLLGGDLALTSQVGRGTTFRFSIPLRAARRVDVERAVDRGEARSLRPGQGEQRLLVVHTDIHIRVLLGDILRRAGFVVREAGHVDEAMSWCEEWHPHLVLVEAGLEGYTSQGECRGVRHVLILGLPLGERERNAPREGQQACIHLPPCEEELLALVADLLGVDYETEAVAEGVTEQAQAPAPVALTRADLSCLGPSLQERLRRANALLDFEQMAALVVEAAETSPCVGEGLRMLVRRYDHDALTDLLRAEEVPA